MKHLTLVIPEGHSRLSTLSCLTGAYEIFLEANKFRRRVGKKDLFKIEIAGISKKVEICDGVFTMKPHINMLEIAKTDLIIIPASIAPNLSKSDKAYMTQVEWVKKQYKMGAEIASMCSGAFMLASSGLLDGKSCSTHWAHTDTFRTMYPNVIIQTDLLITDEHGIYTNGGAYSFLNLMIYLVEKYYDRQTAIFCSKVFQIQMDRNSQSEFTIFTGQKLHEDDTVKKAQSYIESKLHEKISVEYLSSKFAVGRRNFDRRFIKATGNTPVEYMQRVKVESAKKAFESSRKTINEVMYEVGYSDVKAFREVFKKITGMSPIDYRSKYNREARA